MPTSPIDDLFPETLGAIVPEEWLSNAKDEWGYPLITVRLLPKRTDDGIWFVGWLAHVEKALDEWHPDNPDAYKQLVAYPWYRLDSLPSSSNRSIALGVAGRAVKIVLAQMLPYVNPRLHNEVRCIQDTIELQSLIWLRQKVSSVGLNGCI